MTPVAIVLYIENIIFYLINLILLSEVLPKILPT